VRRAKRQKDFETEHSGVFAAPGSLLAHFLAAENPGLSIVAPLIVMAYSFKNARCLRKA
jgi:hypothetical protein